MLCKRGHHHVEVEGGELLRGYGGVVLHQDSQPGAEAFRIKLLVEPGASRTPEVQVEEASQLPRRCQRDELAAILQSIRLNDPVNNFRWQLRDDLRKLRHVE